MSRNVLGEVRFPNFATDSNTGGARVLQNLHDIDILLVRAKIFEEAQRYADAAEHYDQAIRSGSLNEVVRLDAQLELGHNLIMSGRHAEALANVGEVYSTTRHKSDSPGASFRALYLQIDALYRLQEVYNSDAEEGLLRLRNLVDEGLQWLVDVGKAEWRCTLFFLKSRILWKLGQRDLAYELSEIALREKERSECPGFCAADHALQVVKHARLLGYRERAKEILDRYENEVLLGLSKIRFLAQKVRLVRESDGSENSASLEQARRMLLMSAEIHRARERLIAHGELAVAAFSADSRREGYDALERTVDLALKDQTLDKKWLLRKSRSYVQEVLDIAGTKNIGSAKSTGPFLRRFIRRLEEALCAR
jgi:tetratricopeptide (TPR) repeat protein